MRNRVRLGSVLTALLFAVAASVSLAQQVRPPEPQPPRPIVPHPIRTPMPLSGITSGPSAAPGTTPGPSSAPGVPTPQKLGIPRIPSRRVQWGGGLGVSLHGLPALPPQTAENTAHLTGGLPGRHTMAATGASMTYFADTFFNTSCSSVVGTLIPVGCDVYWFPTNLPNPGDNCEDFYIALNNANTPTAYDDGGPSPPAASTYTCGNGSWQFNNVGANDTPNMNSTGTYVIATEDVTKGAWQSVVYLSVGNVNVFGTYADSAATIPQQQFTAANGTNVYVNATGLTQGQQYVVYIESTGTNVFCEYIAPPGSGTPNPGGFCDPTQSTGITAVVGAQHSAAITAVWPLSSSTPTGTYAVVLYNLTTGQRLAMRQVSIKGSAGAGTISLTPVSGNAPLPANWPTPPPNPGAGQTIFPFDSTTEQSDSGWNLSATGLSANTNYTFTVTDPTGAVVSGPTTLTSSGTGTIATSFTFATAQSPSNYISNVYTVQLLKQSNSTVGASQAFQILGYNASTQFQDVSTLAYSNALVLPQGSSATDNLVFTNSGDTLYGSGNGDSLVGFAFNTGKNGITMTLPGSVTTETVADSAGNNWTITNTCSGGGANAGCTITAYPASAGTKMAAAAYLSIPSVQFNNAPGNSRCTSGCSGLTAILPYKGASWSNDNNNASTNTVYFTNSGGKTYGGTASITHVGYLDTSNTFHANQETHGFTNNQTNSIYTSQSPFAPTSGYQDVYSYTVVNNNSAGTTNVKELEIIMPTAYTPSGTLTQVNVYNAGAGNWTYAACPGGAPASAFCLTSNTGISPVGGTDTFEIGFTPPPPSSFSFTDWTIEAVTPTPVTLTPSGTFTGFVPSTSSYDTTATAAYSLTGNLITPAFSPTSAGQNTNNSMTINVTNTSTAQDANPDYLDLIAIDIPTANAFTSVSGMPAGWSELTTTTVGANTRYFFGLCAAQVTTLTITNSVTSCGSGTEANSIKPGSTFTVTGNLATGTSNITATMYAHGANVNGWSTGHSFSLTVTAVAAAAGFSGAGGYPTVTTVTSPNTPQIGADSDTTYGNVFNYVIKNESGTGQNITSAKVVIPGLDVSYVLPADGSAWTLTNTPSISGTSYGCSVTNSVSANRTGTNNGYGADNGGITIGGGSCSIPPGSSITVTFDAKAPYTVNDSYQFTTTVNGATSASELWQTDTFVQIILSATLSITVDPSNPGPGGSTPTVSCVACVFNTGLNSIDYGTVANLSSKSGTDVVRVSVYTNAGSNNAWKLYVDTNNNPANTGTPTNELLTSIDSTNSAPKTGINFDATAYTVVPTTNPGLELMDNGTGLTATRTPYDAIMNFQVNINGGSTAAQTSTVTYTFIAN